MIIEENKKCKRLQLKYNLFDYKSMEKCTKNQEKYCAKR